MLIISYITISLPLRIINAENAENVENSEKNDYGITLSENGKLLLNNSEFNLMGVNTFSMFIDLLNEAKSEEEIENDLSLLSKYEIPFIRIPFCTWNSTSYQMYDNDKEKFFEKMDIIIKKAEEKKIGIIIDFFWNNSTVFYYNGEQRADMGNKNSKSINFSKKYVTDIINRYKNSKALWGYEIGNEYSLSVDLYPSNTVQVAPNFSITNGNYNEKDFYTTNELIVFYTEISNTIRQLDNKRIIINGDSAERAGAYSLYNQTKDITFNNHTSWENNFTFTNKDQYKEMIKKHAPANINTISFHLYEYDLEQIGTFEDYIKKYLETAKEEKKALYLGEFSGNDTRGDNESNFNKTTFDNEMNTITNYKDLQLSSVWMFNRTGNNEGSYIVSDESEKDKYRLEKIKEYNNTSKEILNNYWKEETTVKEEDISSICMPYITYSTKNVTTEKVTATLNFKSEDCKAINKNKVIFEKNGEYTFQYTKNETEQIKTINAKVDWIEEIENPKTGTLLNIIIVITMLVLSILTIIYINNKSLKNNQVI